MNYISRGTSVPDGITHAPGDKAARVPSIPVSIYLQEAENLYCWCRADREKLTRNGLDWRIVEDMPSRIKALRDAQSRWHVSDRYSLETERRWKEIQSTGRRYRKDLARALRFLFRKNPKVPVKIAGLVRGESSAAVIQSLVNLSVFGRQETAFLSAANFDFTELDKAERLARDMSGLLASVNSLRRSYGEMLEKRNHAYTHLQEAVTEIKSHGNYLFRHDPGRLRGYTSAYIRKKNRKARNRSLPGQNGQGLT